MKAMSTTLMLVVAAVVIMVTAIVVLSIFFQGMQPALGLTETKSICMTEATSACAIFGKLPATWNVENRKVTYPDGRKGTESCAQIVSKTGLACICNTETKTLEGCVQPVP
jgi:nitrate/TMAO reductase-like tetraheme cytochrome c subunit